MLPARYDDDDDNYSLICAVYLFLYTDSLRIFRYNMTEIFLNHCLN